MIREGLVLPETSGIVKLGSIFVSFDCFQMPRVGMAAQSRWLGVGGVMAAWGYEVYISSVLEYEVKGRYLLNRLLLDWS